MSKALRFLFPFFLVSILVAGKSFAQVQDTIHAMTNEEANRSCRVGRREMSFFEFLLYNMRHVQEHAAQMNLFLGQKGVPVVSWVAKAKEKI